MSEAKLRNGGGISYHHPHQVHQMHHFALKQANAQDCFPVPLDLSQKSSRIKTNGIILNYLFFFNLLKINFKFLN